MKGRSLNSNFKLFTGPGGHFPAGGSGGPFLRRRPFGFFGRVGGVSIGPLPPPGGDGGGPIGLLQKSPGTCLTGFFGVPKLPFWGGFILWGEIWAYAFGGGTKGGHFQCKTFLGFTLLLLKGFPPKKLVLTHFRGLKEGGGRGRSPFFSGAGGGGPPTPVIHRAHGGPQGGILGVLGTPDGEPGFRAKGWPVMFSNRGPGAFFSFPRVGSLWNPAFLVWALAKVTFCDFGKRVGGMGGGGEPPGPAAKSSPPQGPQRGGASGGIPGWGAWMCPETRCVWGVWRGGHRMFPRGNRAGRGGRGPIFWWGAPFIPPRERRGGGQEPQPQKRFWMIFGGRMEYCLGEQFFLAGKNFLLVFGGGAARRGTAWKKKTGRGAGRGKRRKGNSKKRIGGALRENFKNTLAHRGSPSGLEVTRRPGKKKQFLPVRQSPGRHRGPPPQLWETGGAWRPKGAIKGRISKKASAQPKKKKTPPRGVPAGKKKLGLLISQRGGKKQKKTYFGPWVGALWGEKRGTGQKKKNPGAKLWQTGFVFLPGQCTRNAGGMFWHKARGFRPGAGPKGPGAFWGKGCHPNPAGNPPQTRGRHEPNPGPLKGGRPHTKKNLPADVSGAMRLGSNGGIGGPRLEFFFFSGGGRGPWEPRI